MGLFPAAFTLAGNGFDVVSLLQMPGFLQGGPNTHSTSLVTLFTGLVLMVLGGGPIALAVLYLSHFLVTAVVSTALGGKLRRVGASELDQIDRRAVLHSVVNALLRQRGWTAIPARRRY
jgi:hypothetical protein